MSFDHLVGQPKLKRVLVALLADAWLRRGGFRAINFIGQPGSGKTAFANACVDLCGGTFVEPDRRDLLQKPEHVHKMLEIMEPRSVLFVDEAHGLPNSVLEALYPVIDQGGVARKVGEHEVFVPIGLIFATNLPGQLPDALRTRLHEATFERYSVQDLRHLVEDRGIRNCRSFTPQAARVVAENSQARPRSAVMLTDDVCRLVRGTDRLNQEDVQHALDLLGIEGEGLRPMQVEYLGQLEKMGGRASLEALTRALGVDARYIKEDVEPWLVSCGYVTIEKQGRLLLRPRPGSRRHGASEPPRLLLEMRKR